MNKYLEAVARKYVHARFARIVATEADDKYDDVALPTILAYLGGSLVANITHATDELSDPFEIVDVETMLLKFVFLSFLSCFFCSDLLFFLAPHNSLP